MTKKLKIQSPKLKRKPIMDLKLQHSPSRVQICNQISPRALHQPSTSKKSKNKSNEKSTKHSWPSMKRRRLVRLRRTTRVRRKTKPNWRALLSQYSKSLLLKKWMKVSEKTALWHLLYSASPAKFSITPSSNISRPPTWKPWRAATQNSFWPKGRGLAPLKMNWCSRRSSSVSVCWEVWIKSEWKKEWKFN